MSTGCRWCAPAPSLWVCSVHFSLPLPSFPLSFPALPFKYALFSVLRGFRGFYGAGVCLYGLRFLRGLWGFCTRVELGGYVPCGVFAPIFPFFHLLRLSSGALPLLSLACPLSLPCLSLWLVLGFPFVGVVVSFSLTDVCAKRKGAKYCSLRPLSVFCSVVQILVTLSKNSVAVALAFSSSFGLYSQLIQQESEGLPVLTLIRSGIMSI